ncbi:MAG TPA: complex I NDUFA9 subunit family protein [Xanthomonadaceae bacterium]|nr:complex I NDUFA9 subunit family protein [Xanthomonadaceae bacterium]
MNPRRIVVLGGTGFVGSHLVPRLHEDGHQILVLTRNRESNRELLVLPRVSLTSCDVHQEPVLRRHFEGAHAVINLVGVLDGGSSGRGFRRVHVELAGKVVAACKGAGVRRLLHMSALNAGRGESQYLASKGEAEKQVKASGLDWTIFQPSVIFGRGDGLFNRFAGLLKLAPVLPIGRAGCKFAPVYVGDVCEAFARCLADGDTVGEVYELYGPDTMTLREIVEYTARQLGLRRWVVPLPDALGRLQAIAGEFLPGKPITRDAFRSLKLDSVGGIDGLFRLGIERTPVEAVVPQLLGGTPRQTRLDQDRMDAAGRRRH